MKKLLLPIIAFLVFLSLTKYSYAQDYQTSKDCLKERHNAEYECGQIHKACVERCSGQYIDKCIGACFDEEYKCDDVAKAEYDKCLTGQSSETPVSSSLPKAEIVVPTSMPVSEPTDQPETTSPVKDEPFILKFLGTNPYELWLRLLTWSNAPKLRFWLTEMNTSEILELNYKEDGTISVEIDSSSAFPANPDMTTTRNTSGAQIRTRGGFEYQNLDPNQDIPDGAYIRINKPTRFDIGNGDNQIEVEPVGQTGWAEFQIQKSKKNESVDIIEAIGSKVLVRPLADGGIQSPPEITNEVETDAWKMPTPAGEKLIDVPGVENTKKYSWDDDSEAVIKSNDWEKIEFKDSTVKLKGGEMEVKVRNDNPTENRFTVDANGFFDAVVVQTHFFVSFNPETKKGAVIVYEGEVEVKTNDGKVVKVKPEGDPSTGSGQVKPGVVVLSQKLSAVKLGIVGIVLAAVIAGIVLLVKRKIDATSKKKK